MREALETIRRAMINTGNLRKATGDNADPRYPIWNAVVAALAPDAGRAFLERLEKAERIVEFDRLVAFAAHRREALEDAAEVAEAAPDFSVFHGGLVARSDLAAAIRALAEKEGE
jgi:ADP-ribose pyrophosphatase YjhB (NUDIX family)